MSFFYFHVNYNIDDFRLIIWQGHVIDCHSNIILIKYTNNNHLAYRPRHREMSMLLWFDRSDNALYISFLWQLKEY